jgi:hypothetical protein
MSSTNLAVARHAPPQWLRDFLGYFGVGLVLAGRRYR